MKLFFDSSIIIEEIIASSVKYYNLDYLVTLDNDYENLDIRVFQ